MTGLQDFEFRLFNAAAGGAQQGATIPVADWGVTNGLFTVPLDFGAAAFPGADRWLQIAVRAGANTGSYTTLSPRQQITSTPYAVTARGISGTLPAGQLPANVALMDRAQTFSANQTFQTRATFNGRVGIGTNVPQEALHVAGSYVRVDGFGNEQAILGGDGAGGDVELGSSNPGIGAVALFNQGTGDYMHLFAKGATFFGPISGDGSGLTALPAGQLSGSLADAQLSANVALRSGGNNFSGNQAFAGNHSFGNQTRQMINLWSTEYGIGVQADAAYFRSSGEFHWYRGGIHHDALGNAGAGGSSLMRLDGSGNLMPRGWLGIGISSPAFLVDVQGPLAAARLSTTNSVNGAVLVLRNTTASPTYLGAINFERNNSPVGQIGYFNNDRMGFRVADTERMTLNASGYLGLGTTTPGTHLDVVAAQGLGRFTSTNAINGSVLIFNNRSASPDYLGAINFETNGTTVGQIAYLANDQMVFRAGGAERMSLQSGLLTVQGVGNEKAFIGGAANEVVIGSAKASVNNIRFANLTEFPNRPMDCYARTFNPTSDRQAKQDFRSVEATAILEKVVALPISEWAYKGDSATRHIGPVAQDFKQAFGLGSSDKSIATVDADGVALAAIQGLNDKVEARSQESGARVQKLEEENAALKQRLESIEQLLNKLVKE